MDAAAEAKMAHSKRRFPSKRAAISPNSWMEICGHPGSGWHFLSVRFEEVPLTRSSNGPAPAESGENALGSPSIAQR
jgi:hypothetical protein